MTILLQGATIVDPSQDLNRKTDLLIEKGKVARLGKIKPQKSWKVIDLSGKVVMPGLIDMHVHLREPGREDKETIRTGTHAAAAGGFTSVACMPNTSPVNDCEAITRFIREKAREAGFSNVFPVGAVTKHSKGEELAEIGEMVQAGAVAISDDGRPIQNNQIMRRALEYVKVFDIPILDHCEDIPLAAKGSMNESSVSTELGLRGLNRAAEEVHVARDLMLSRFTGSRVHICHLSTRESLDWVREGKEKGVKITCEVTPHHYLLTDEEVRTYDTNFKMNPPLRTKDDVEAMLEGLADGTIDCIATDHAPHNVLDKETTFEDAANGIIGLESAVPLTCEHLIRTERISLTRMAELMSVNPSLILKLNRGTLVEGAIADVTVIDLDREVTIDPSKFKSKARNCPFSGWECHGAPVMTIVRGRVVWSA